MDKLNVAQTLFTVFFAICWGSSANVWGRWKAFNYPVFHWHAITRASVSIVFLNLIPVAYFWAVLFVLSPVNNAPGGMWGWFVEVIRGVIPAFGMFGIYRLWLFVLECKCEWFYFKKDGLPDWLRKIEELWGSEIRRKIEPALEELEIGKGVPRWWLNGVMGAIYMGIAFVVGLFVTRYCL